MSQDPGSEPEVDRWQRAGERLGQLLVLPILLLLAVGIVYAIADAITSDRNEISDPDFLDTIFASDAVIAAVRIAIIAAAAYAAIAAIALAVRRQWPKRFGPVEIASSVTDFEEANVTLARALEEAQTTIDELEEELEETTAKLNTALDILFRDADDEGDP